MKLQLFDLVLFYNFTTNVRSFETINEIRTVHTSNGKTTMCSTNRFKFDATNLQILHKHPILRDKYVYDNEEVIMRVWRFNEITKNWEWLEK